MSKLASFYKAFPGLLVEKPGDATHTAKWDRCVRNVEAKGTGNAYAICTAAMGADSFKTMTDNDFDKAIDFILNE